MKNRYLAHRQSQRHHAALGYRVYRFENEHREVLSGYGEGDFIRLRDSKGNEWHGSADPQGDFVRLSFRSGLGEHATGIVNAMGAMLKDNHGMVWRGYLQ